VYHYFRIWKNFSGSFVSVRFWPVLPVNGCDWNCIIDSGLVNWQLSLSRYYVFVMSPVNIPPMTPERWIANLLEAIANIADKEHQEKRWLAPDAQAWECPDELINVLDDCVFDGFMGKYASTFSDEQREAAFQFKDELTLYCAITPQHLESADVLADPRWERVRQKAAAFLMVFRDKWPSP
jgi:hypothetical protein